jgi:glycosidase
VSQNKGVLVRTVEKGSPGAAAGIRAGDVIVKVDNEIVHDTADWRRALKGHGNKVTMVIMRDKREQTVQMAMPGNTSEWKARDWDGFGVDAATLAMLNSDEMKELQGQAETMAKTLTPEIKKQAEEMSKQAEQLRKEIEKMTPEMAKNAREMAESMKPSAKELSDMTRDLTKQWKEMQPEFQKQMDDLKKQLEEQQREWQKMFHESNPKQM